MKEKVVLAYSGGLDTSVILKWLSNKGYDVIAYVADVGQQEDFEKIKQKAIKTGASAVYVEDLKKEFVENYIFPSIKIGAVYEGQYLLGTSLARPLIAKHQVEIAKKEGATILAHGCTGKGNDQIRFELVWMQFMPDVKIISPWKDKEFLEKFKGRDDLINYAVHHDIDITASHQKPYSIDENIMHTSYESGILENPAAEGFFSIHGKIKTPFESPDTATEIILEFEKGIPVLVTEGSTGTKTTGAVAILSKLNELAQANGVGRIDIVENRFIGMKSRGIYDTPGGTVLMKAHQDIESITLDKEVLHLKHMFIPMIAKLIYNGLWFSPEMEFFMAAIEKSQLNVTGRVKMFLYKGNAIVVSRDSPKSLYNSKLVSMQEEGGFNQLDSIGFIKIMGLRLKGTGDGK